MLHVNVQRCARVHAGTLKAVVKHASAGLPTSLCHACCSASPALQGVSQDTRPEVRNSGVRTLFAVVVNQGPRLSRALWEQCLWEMLFPLLNHAFLMSATASRDEVRTWRDEWVQQGTASFAAKLAC